MNETIGGKGGKNDRRRRLIITKNNKEKLEKYYKKLNQERLKELENKVQRQQILTFFKILPIVTVGTIYQTITEKTKEQKEIEILKEYEEHIIRSNLFEEKRSKEIIQAIELKIKQLQLIIQNPKLQQVLNQTDKLYLQISDSEVLILDLINKNNLTTSLLNNLKEQEKDLLITAEELEYISKLDKNEIKEIATKDLFSSTEKKEIIASKLAGNKTDNKKIKVEIKELVQDKIPLKESAAITLEQLKNHKIIEEYEKNLKDIRRELRILMFEYNTIDQELNEMYSSKEAEQLLDRLNTLIKKIEELKRKIELPDIDKYDSNYLYTLVEEYIEEFKNQNFVQEIKDSNLYISIANKLNELDEKKDLLSEKIENKKATLELDEDRFKEMKKQYYNYDKFNNELIKIQNEQDIILRDINERIANATTVQERVEVQIRGMQRQNRIMLNEIRTQMTLPGARSARGISTLAALSMYFIRNIMHPRTRTKRYATINVADYHEQIENTISRLDDIEDMIKRTSNQIEHIIRDFKKEYKDYFDVIPECQKLLDDLEKIRDSIKEKEYELAKIKEEQERNLERNNAQVLQYTRNE